MPRLIVVGVLGRNEYVCAGRVRDPVGSAVDCLVSVSCKTGIFTVIHREICFFVCAPGGGIRHGDAGRLVRGFPVGSTVDCLVSMLPVRCKQSFQR
jgi:hypothetical protein